MRDYSKLRPAEKAWSSKKAWRLYLSNWRLCHQIVDLRDDHKCLIPDCYETEDLDLDHAITRGRKATFFETDILGYLCKRHHQSKSFGVGNPVDKMVDVYHVKRLGKKRWDELIEKANTDFPAFRYVWHQEIVNEELNEKLEYYKIRAD